MSRIKRESSRPAVIAQRSENKNYYAVAMGVGVGVAFGFFLEKGKVAMPAIIREQMEMKNFVMMEMFLAASATGTLSAYLLKALGINPTRGASAMALGFDLMNGYGANVVGGMLMGAGMVIGGSCPGTAAAAVGGGVWTGGVVILGGLLGSAAFAHFRTWYQQRNRAFHVKSKSTLVDQALGRSHLEMAVAFAGSIAGGLYILDGYFPWSEGLKTAFQPGYAFDSSFSLRADAWHPAIAGALIGLLQIPSFIFLDRYLGASSCYVTGACVIEETLVNSNARSDTPYYKDYFTFTDLAQLGTVIGIAAGAYISASLSGDSYLHVPIFSAPVAAQSLIGGFVLLFGARLSGGCASGHGLSGMARLSLASGLTVAGMFAGGMLAAATVLPHLYV